MRDRKETVPGGLPTWLAWLPARFTRPRFVDREGAASQGRAVEGVYGTLRCAGVRHLNEAKTPRPAGLAVGHNPDGFYRAIRLEELAEVLLRRAKSQVAHKNVHGWFPPSIGAHWCSGIPPSPNIGRQRHHAAVDRKSP